MQNVKTGFFLARKKILKDKSIFIFTCLIVTLGFLNVFFLTSFITGMGDKLNNQLIELQFGNIIISPNTDNTFIDNADDILNKIKRVPGVIGAAKRLKVGATLQTENGDATVSPWRLMGIEPEEEIYVTKWQDYIDGSYLSKSDSDKLIIGSEMVGRNNGLILPIEDSLQSNIGDEIYITYENSVRKKYKLKGIIDAKDLYSIISAYITIEEAENILDVKNKASMIVVRVPTGKEAEYVRKFQELGVSETILTWKDKAMTTAALTRSFDILNNIFKVVGLFIIFITIIIIIYINILNNKKGIGIFRAIGIKRSTIIYSYLGMSLLYAAVGSFFGSILIFVLFKYLEINPIQGPVGSMFPIFDAVVFVISIILIIISALLGALIPAIKVNRENIMDLISGR